MLFFELLQVALGNREGLHHVPTIKEWRGIYDESTRQAVTGLLLKGIDRLPVEQRPSRVFLLQWIGEGQMIEQQNKMMDEHCQRLLKMLDERGLKGSILKGQGVALLYDYEMRSLRQPGDIDVYMDCGMKGVMAFVKSLGQENYEWDYKHLHLRIWDGVEVEMHYRIEVLLNLWKNRKLQKWFLMHHDAIQGSTLRVQGSEIVTPSVEFNVFYILLHIYRHFLYQGVGMRQIIDYYMVLHNVHDAGLKVKSYVEAVHEFGMDKFARGLMWVMHDTLGMPCDWMLWESNQKEGEYILKHIMKGGNFGHFDGRLNHGKGKLGAVRAILTHNFHLLTHYPSDTIWAPVWFVWHKLWKIKMNITL